ncbi:GGDEF domain-containing protein [Methylobacterium sp. SI9]|uniref:GGDEF domain-containing protein n=1 Tax=Methylobacterium guangdongense TaxID=3138811 RepID=UPI00313DAB45
MSFYNLAPFGTIRIASERDLRAYVAQTTAFCVSAALACDVVNQLIFFEGWTAAVRSWVVTVVVVVAVALPVSRTIAAAHLTLFRSGQTDHLTGLANRRALLDRADDPKLIALVIADIDRFKAVNDGYGHLTGDAVLKAVADLMRAELADLGLVGRLGGEEFALICTDGDEGDLVRRLEAFREAVARTPIAAGDGLTVPVTISAGVARRTSDQSFRELYAEADKALYIAKASGRNQIVMAETASSSPDGTAE